MTAAVESARWNAQRNNERTALMGMALFIGSWAMLFAGLFFAYGAVRLGSPAWPPPDLPKLPVGLPALASVPLILSSLSLHAALPRARAGLAPFGQVLLACALGALFLGIQIFVWRNLFSAGLTPNTGTYASVFYGLTVFHALHVVVGLVAMVWIAVRFGVRRLRPATQAPVLGLRLWSLYWHMVGVLWALIFVLVYLL